MALHTDGNWMNVICSLYCLILEVQRISNESLDFTVYNVDRKIWEFKPLVAPVLLTDAEKSIEELESGSENQLCHFVLTAVFFTVSRSCSSKYIISNSSNFTSLPTQSATVEPRLTDTAQWWIPVI